MLAISPLIVVLIVAAALARLADMRPSPRQELIKVRVERARRP